MMGKPTFQREGQVNLADFRQVVSAVGGRSKFSDHEVKQVFNSHAVDPPKQGAQSSLGGGEQFIPVRDFKDVFLPALRWKSDEARGLNQIDQKSGASGAGSNSASKTESM